VVTIGIDTHKATLAACAVDEMGRELAASTFAIDLRGHRRLLAWARRLGPERRFGIEGSGSFGAALARGLLAAGEMVTEVPATLTDRERRHLRPRGKSDPADALAIARVVLREPTLHPLMLVALADDLKQLVGARDESQAERTRVANRLHADLLVLVPGYGERIPTLVAGRHLAAAGRLLGRSTAVRTQLARKRLARLRALDHEIGDLEVQLADLVAVSGSSLPRLPGIGTLLAAKLLGETGDVRRFRSEAAFAAVTGTAPIPASSGQTQRHRLNRGGNRQLNRALHFMAIVQARTYPAARAYVARRQAEGKTWREALRCLKRHLADVVYRPCCWISAPPKSGLDEIGAHELGLDPPSEGPRASVFVRQVLPGPAVCRVVLADRAPLPVGKVGAPAVPRRNAAPSLGQSIVLCQVTLPQHGPWQRRSPSLAPP
jgi:transposase